MDDGRVPPVFCDNSIRCRLMLEAGEPSDCEKRELCFGNAGSNPPMSCPSGLDMPMETVWNSPAGKENPGHAAESVFLHLGALYCLTGSIGKCAEKMEIPQEAIVNILRRHGSFRRGFVGVALRGKSQLERLMTLASWSRRVAAELAGVSMPALRGALRAAGFTDDVIEKARFDARKRALVDAAGHVVSACGSVEEANDFLGRTERGREILGEIRSLWGSMAKFMDQMGMAVTERSAENAAG